MTSTITIPATEAETADARRTVTESQPQTAAATKTAPAVPEAHAAPEAEELPTLEFVPVADLVIGDNVRKEPRLKRTFVDSLRRLGNFDAIIGYRREDGKVVVVDGQRRTYGLRKVGRENAKVELWPTRNDAMGAANRLEIQVMANAGEPLTESEIGGAIADMLELGISEADTSKRLGVDSSQVKAVRALTKSQNSRALVEDGQLSLTEAAAAAEFAEDETATARLVAAAGRGIFAHTLAEVRAERDAEAARAGVIAEHQSRGFEVLDEDVYFTEYHSSTPFHLLRRLEGDGGQPTADDIKNPAHWSVYFTEREEITVTETGETVEEWKVDWRTSNDPHTVARRGKFHAAQVQVETVLRPSYYCRDAAAEGLRSVAGRGTSKDEEAIAAEKAAKAAESQRAGLCNELARTATPVRREWVRDKLAKGLPADALLWAVRVLTEEPGLISENAAAAIAQELAGPKGYALATGQARSKAAIDRAQARTQVVVVAMVFGAIEARMQPNDQRPNYWRGGTLTAGASPERRRGRIADYLALLSSWGYALSRIESVAIGTADVDEVAAEAKAARAAKAAAKKATKKK